MSHALAITDKSGVSYGLALLNEALRTRSLLENVQFLINVQSH